jgi:hypothetical protein
MSNCLSTMIIMIQVGHGSKVARVRMATGVATDLNSWRYL